MANRYTFIRPELIWNWKEKARRLNKRKSRQEKAKLRLVDTCLKGEEITVCIDGSASYICIPPNDDSGNYKIIWTFISSPDDLIFYLTSGNRTTHCVGITLKEAIAIIEGATQ